MVRKFQDGTGKGEMIAFAPTSEKPFLYPIFWVFKGTDYD
jgi:hypothetical protein